MQKKDLPKMPNTPGVYLFKRGKEVLYVGRATSLVDRVKSYFGDDLIETRGPLLVDMVTTSKKLDFIKTDSVLEAIILEANLIKKWKPFYNTKEKDDKSFYFVCITKETFPKVTLLREKDLRLPTYDLLAKFGPFPSGETIREALKIIRKIFPFQDDSSAKRDQFTFYRQLGLVPDLSKEEAKKAYRKNIDNLILFFQGKKDRVIKNLEREMKTLAKLREFEQASLVRNKIFALKHIQDVSLLKKDDVKRNTTGFRIEAYDISHIGGTNMVGVMTVVTDGEPDKNKYRKFKIRGFDKSNDVGALAEVINRRLGHPEWAYPKLVVVDGSVAQKRRVENIFNELGIKIPVVAVVKNERHKPKALLGDKTLAHKYEKDILLANAESHRFAVSYHQNRRGLALRNAKM